MIKIKFNYNRLAQLFIIIHIIITKIILLLVYLDSFCSTPYKTRRCYLFDDEDGIVDELPPQKPTEVVESDAKMFIAIGIRDDDGDAMTRDAPGREPSTTATQPPVVCWSVFPFKLLPGE